MLAGRLCFSQCELVALPPRLHNMLFSVHSMAIVTVSHRIGGKGMAKERPRERTVRQRGRRGVGGATWHLLLQVKPLINYDLKIITFLICFATFPIVLPAIFFLLLFTYLSLFVFTAPSRLHHMAADQIMSNILPLQVFFLLLLLFFLFFFMQFAVSECETCWKSEW